mmetsp:Transcript_3545/g.6617  ORF Transcript_3545/g.6617 Transcript_3545/m.6617 type:complete len:82 (-) Transcript_3545:700-945(-)
MPQSPVPFDAPHPSTRVFALERKSAGQEQWWFAGKRTSVEENCPLRCGAKTKKWKLSTAACCYPPAAVLGIYSNPCFLEYQ